MTYEEIFENNAQWVQQKLGIDPEYFNKLSEGQSPEFLFIGCSDSRVTAEELMGAQPGQVFIHRNIANLVPNNDNNSASVVEYAIGHLGVKNVVVCGHYLCGGVKAAMQNADLGILNPWLRTIRDVFRIHREELMAIEEEDRRYDRLVELNVEEQCINIVKMAVYQKAYIKTGFPKLYGWVFDVRTGKLIDLKIDFRTVLSKIREIYDLGTNG